MVRLLYLLFGAVAYCVFLATFLYMVGFIADVAWLPHTVDRPVAIGSRAIRAAVDLVLIAIFGLQHSIMARQGFKQAWVRIIPAPVERSVFVVFASLALVLLFAFWHPLPRVIWHVADGAAAAILWTLFALGWAIVLLSTFLISHFELFGLKQVWNHLRGSTIDPPIFRQPFLYRLVRHPLYVGFFIAFWATPRMTIGHLLLAGGMSLYMLVAIEFEERDLVRIFGGQYEIYRAGVGKLLPRLRGSGKPDGARSLRR